MTLSTIAAQLKKGYEPYFLIECNFDGYYDRIATRPISIPNSGTYAKFFDGKMINDIHYGASFSFDNMTYNIGSIQVTRNNADRFQDQEGLRRLDGGICTVYIWCEGLTWADIHPHGIVSTGTFEKVSHNKYNYVYNINDLSKSDKYGLVPKITINDSTWPLHRKAGGAGSVSGDFVPIVFGDYPYGVICKCVDTSSDFLYIVTSGISKSLDADFTAGTEAVKDNEGVTINAGNYELQQTVDSLGNPCTILDFIGNYASEEPISCSIQGITDGSGEYTGTAGTLIEHPSDIVEYLVDNFGSVASSYTDVETFKSLKVVFPALKYCLSIVNQTNLTEIIDRILSQVGCASTQRLGGYQGIMIFDTDKSPSARLIQNQVQIGREATFTKTPERLICNKLELQYGLNVSTGKFEKSIFKNKSMTPECLQSYIQHGKEYEKTIQLQDIHDDSTAELIATNYIDIFAFRHDMMEWQVPTYEGIEIRRGDVAMITIAEGGSLDGTGWNQEPCILVEKKYKKNMISQTWWKIAT